VYVMRNPQDGRYKVGEAGDVRKRLASHRTACPDIELVAAVQSPSANALEDRLLAHFKDARVGTSEWLEPKPEVETWVQRFASRPNVARSPEYVQHSYTTPDLWPWSDPDPLANQDGQLGMPFTVPYLAEVGSGNGQTSAVSEDWYTPAIYIAAVREVFGGTIDLDPASCQEANNTVQAENIYTAEVDGLRHRWNGNVFLNPPWGRTGRTKKAFVTRAIHAYKSGEIVQAILALNSNATTSAWFEPLFEYPICFPNHRVAHRGPGGAGGAPNSGTVFIYLGLAVARFAEIFSEFGRVVPSAYPRARANAVLPGDYDEEEIDRPSHPILGGKVRGPEGNHHA
jgi:DNA N-6-adenine-methyltransferase (Dam)/T5orf172 domain